MFKLFKEAFKTSNDCIILAFPLVLFMWILSFYFAFSNSVVNTPAEIILAFVTVLFMVCAFLSGWFYMVQQAIEVAGQVYVLDEDRAKATMNLFKVIPFGIGKYFLSFIGMIIIFLIVVSLTGAAVYYTGIKSYRKRIYSRTDHRCPKFNSGYESLYRFAFTRSAYKA